MAAPYSIFDGFTVDETGKIVRNALVTVKTSGGDLVPLYQNRQGLASYRYPSGQLPNPLTSSLTGRVKFYADPGEYKMSAKNIVTGADIFYDITIPDESVASEYNLYENTIKDSLGNPVLDAQVTVRLASGELADIFSDEGTTPLSNPLSVDENGAVSFYAEDGRYKITAYSPTNGSEVFYDVLIPVVILIEGVDPEEPPVLIYNYTYSTPTPASFAEKYAYYPNDQIEILEGVSSGFRTILEDGLGELPPEIEASFVGVTDPFTKPYAEGWNAFEFGFYAGYVKQIDDNLIFTSGSAQLEFTITGDNIPDFDTLFARGYYSAPYEYANDSFFIWDLGTGEIPSEFSSGSGSASVQVKTLNYYGFTESSFILENSHGIVDDNYTGGRLLASFNGAASVQIDNETTTPLSTGWNVTIRNYTDDDLEIIADTGVTITPPVGGTLFIPRLYAAKITRTGVNTFTMTGVTVPA